MGSDRYSRTSYKPVLDATWDASGQEPKSVTTILAVMPNPKWTDPLRLGEEERVIKQCIERSTRRRDLVLDTRHAATVDDLARALLEKRYDIVQISGHGTKRGLLFEDDRGEPFVPPPAALARLFADHSPPIRCVILNSCYSLNQGILTALGVPYTIASERPLADEAAIEFTRGFYDGIGVGRDIEEAYEEGLRRCQLKGFDPRRLPSLLDQMEVSQWERDRLPIPLDDGSVVAASDLAGQGECSCERGSCVDATGKAYCYWPKELPRWVITKHLYKKCYDERVRCPRCRRKHKRGHIGKRGRCGRPFLHQILQRD